MHFFFFDKEIPRYAFFFFDKEIPPYACICNCEKGGMILGVLARWQFYLIM